MRREVLTGLVVGLAFAFQASNRPAVARESGCTATAEFSGNSTAIEMDVDGKGRPMKGSQVSYQPAGLHQTGMVLIAVYPFNLDRLPQVAAPTELLVMACGNEHRRFVLSIGGEQFRSLGPKAVLPGVPECGGKVQVHQDFQLDKRLIDALAAGGTGKLEVIDDKGAPLAQADLSFSSIEVIQKAVDQSYPLALSYVRNGDKC